MCDEEREFLVMSFDHDGGVDREAWTGEVEPADAIAEVARLEADEATTTAARALDVLDVAAVASRRPRRLVDLLLAIALAAVVIVWFAGLAAVADWLW